VSRDGQGRRRGIEADVSSSAVLAAGG